MEETRNQPSSLLQAQIQSLQVAIERMPEQIATILLAAQEAKQPLAAHANHRHTNQIIEEGHSFLLDEELPNSSNRSMGHDIAPEAQVQRLTAQLTAAYNRIAALEEQLLAQRLQQ